MNMMNSIQEIENKIKQVLIQEAILLGVMEKQTCIAVLFDDGTEYGHWFYIPMYDAAKELDAEGQNLLKDELRKKGVLFTPYREFPFEFSEKTFEKEEPFIDRIRLIQLGTQHGILHQEECVSVFGITRNGDEHLMWIPISEASDLLNKDNLHENIMNKIEEDIEVRYQGIEITEEQKQSICDIEDILFQFLASAVIYIEGHMAQFGATDTDIMAIKYKSEFLNKYREIFLPLIDSRVLYDKETSAKLVWAVYKKYKYFKGESGQ